MTKDGTHINDLEIVEQLKTAHDKIIKEIGKVIVGQKKVIDELLIGLSSIKRKYLF